MRKTPDDDHWSGAPPRPSRAFLRRMLLTSMLAQFTGMVVVQLPMFLIPQFYLEEGLTLGQAGLIAASTQAGMLVSMALWGLAVDTIGERQAILWGVSIAASAALAATQVHNLWAYAACLFLCGVGASSASSASGRVVVGWFPPSQRATAMGIRQVSQPVAFAATALVVPSLASAVGVYHAMYLASGLSALTVAVVWLVLVDPPLSESDLKIIASGQTNPYRGSYDLARIHLASALLTLPQMALYGFAVVWMVAEHGVDLVLASVIVAATQVLGGVGRVVIGMWSDRINDRLRPMALTAWAGAGTLAVFALLAATPLGIVLMVAASVMATSANSIGLTLAAELAGPAWGGRTMGIQLTAQILGAVAITPTFGYLVARFDYAAAYWLLVPASMIAARLTPRAKRAPGRTRGRIQRGRPRSSPARRIGP